MISRSMSRKLCLLVQWHLKKRLERDGAQDREFRWKMKTSLMQAIQCCHDIHTVLLQYHLRLAFLIIVADLISFRKWFCRAITMHFWA
eukprot:UN12890